MHIHLKYIHLVIRGDLVHIIHCIVIYMSYYEYVLGLNMAFIAETCC